MYDDILAHAARIWILILVPLHCSFFSVCIIEYATAGGIELGLVVKAKDHHIRDMHCNVGFPYKLQCVRKYLSILLLCATQIANNFRLDRTMANMIELHSFGDKLFHKRVWPI